MDVQFSHIQRSRQELELAYSYTEVFILFYLPHNNSANNIGIYVKKKMWLGDLTETVAGAPKDNFLLYTDIENTF